MSLMQDENWQRSLLNLRAIVPFRYAQWIYEDPHDLEFRVAADASQDSFAIAHRTGIVGQVFRTGHPVFLADVRTHPLYDPFDPEIMWECVLPFTTTDGGRVVLNLEGVDGWSDADGLVTRLPDLLGALPLTGYPTRLPRTLAALSGDAAALLAKCEELARAGHWVAVVGFFPEHAPKGHLTYHEAVRQNRALAECVFPFKPRIDLFLLDACPVDDTAKIMALLGGGRYDFVFFLGA
jgi:hypothetical protein